MKEANKTPKGLQPLGAISPPRQALLTSSGHRHSESQLCPRLPSQRMEAFLPAPPAGRQPACRAALLLIAQERPA